jgi:hypothetical protein
MFQFSNHTLALLHQAGWSEDYNYDTTEWESLLKAAGYTVHLVARDFMQRFGGLVIDYPHPMVPTVTVQLKFTVSFGRDKIAKDWAREASQDLAVLFPDLDGCDIGSFNSDDYWLMMDVSGIVYGYGDAYFRVGDSGEEAIEHICSQNYGEDLAYRFEALMEDT